MLKDLPDESFDCCVTSPPYWGLRDYGHPDQIGLEATPAEYVEKLIGVFREVRRVLRSDGTLWLNLGDTYASGKGGAGQPPGGGEQGRKWKGRGAHKPETSGKASTRVAAMGPMQQPNRIPIVGLKPKDLIGIPWRVAFALQQDGWWLRSDIIWSKLSCMPESVTDRPTRSHEYVFLFSKSERYAYDATAIQEEAVCGDHFRNEREPATSHVPGASKQTGIRKQEDGYEKRNARSVWAINSDRNDESHFAVMPRELVQRCILAGSRLGGIVLDPFIGTGTVGEVAEQFGRKWVGVDLGYAELSKRRTKQVGLPYERQS